MKILSHRGYWLSEEEKNANVAFNRSFTIGVGTETDVRDFNGELVISHDIATGKEITLKSFLENASSHARREPLTLALNIKADGLAFHISQAIRDFNQLDCFVFDMSVPDMRDYFKYEIPVFTRLSEVEQEPIWLDQCSGMWLDSFELEWFSNSLILDYINKQKKICIVSPDLHHRDHLDLWERIKPLAENPLLMLCTDYPEQALNFFHIQFII